MRDNLTIREIAAADRASRDWINPYLLDFYCQFGAETGRVEPEYFARAAQVGDLRADACHCLDQGHRLFVVLEHDTPIGYATITTPEGYWRGPYMHLEELFILAAYRSQGIGGWLYTEVVSRIKQELPDLVQVTVGTLYRNEAARRFYRRLGFREYYTYLVSPLAEKAHD